MALAVGCMMAAVPAALLPLPFSLGILVLLVAGIPQTEAVTIFIAAITAYFVTHGFGLIPQPSHEEE
jgi:hypothetical protein